MSDNQNGDSGAGTTTSLLAAEPPPGAPGEAQGTIEAAAQASLPAWAALIFQFLIHPQGKQLAENLGKMLEESREKNRQQHTINFLNTIGRYLLVGLILGLMTYLKLQKAFDAEVAALLGLALGYVFGKSRK